MAGEGKVVCVTGASGYIASWLVKLLLDRSYTVKATVRSLNDPRKTEHLLALAGAKERLHLFEANLIDEGSFDPVVDGCDGVFHTASPATFVATDPQTEIIYPAVEGTHNVLNSCSKVPSLKTVVLTSSMAAVLHTGKPKNPDDVIDETWFSDPVFCEKSKMWYQVSKTLAEEAAWRFAKERGIDLVALHPSYVLGPLLQPLLNHSSEGFLDFVRTGREVFPDAIYRFVDVRDVANAHILAFEIPSALGRYCLVEKVAHSSEIVMILRKLFPDLSLPEKLKDEKPPLLHVQTSQERARRLGINFTSFEVSLRDTVGSLREKNFLCF